MLFGQALVGITVGSTLCTAITTGVPRSAFWERGSANLTLIRTSCPREVDLSCDEKV
ncbi:hypothetical protein D3C73_937140 [compost metagenome]